jgi:hypothetical protein
MGAFKTLGKVMVLLILGAALAGVFMLVRSSKDAEPVSYEQWPDVPRNPAA